MPPIRSLSGLCLTLALLACGDDPADPGTGAIEVTTVSTGQGLDTDGYVVDVEGAGTLPVGINATATLEEVPEGDVEIRLTGIRGNCSVQEPHPRIVRVVAGETFRASFDVVCAHTPLLGRIVFTSTREGSYEIYSMNADGSDPVRLTTPAEDERKFEPAVSPDGSRILFVNGIGPEDDFYTGYLYVMGADGSDPTRLPPLQGGFIHAPVWSPDGSRIAFWGWIDDNGFEIWVMNADGTGLTNVTNTPDAGESSPSWSPDGRRILFTSGGRLEVMNADGTGRSLLGGENAAEGTWSPDGTRIAFISYENERSRLYTMLAGGTGRAPLRADAGGHDGRASWSPSGDRLAFTYAVDPFVDVYVVNADGTGAVNVSANDTFENLGPQAWGP